ncbi:MAG: hypothetical protein A3D13_06530 [Planctomycetes bacterium RIFCSPHIGHO2_02_FULL_40_12]|nr:MAG: hypothetical protein A3D13_06530 [Planctomycetes bacterium RIFCSPHIGHO2_02_FULL_40_12]
MNKTIINYFWKYTHIQVAFLVIFTGFLFVFDLGSRDLWAPDEPRYAQVAREMLENKNFVLPHLNGEVYPDKPPLLFWLIDLFSMPFRTVTEFFARLPSALSGIGCCIAVFFLGKFTFSQRTGFIAALILATNVNFLWIARRSAFDVLLTFLITMSLLCFYSGYSRDSKRTILFLLSYVFMGLAVLTKGPLGLFLPVIIIASFLVMEGNLKLYRYMAIGRGCIVFSIIVFSWFVLASLEGGKEYVSEILNNQIMGRFFNSWKDKEPFYYYFIRFPMEFMPWSLFIPGVVIYSIKEKNKGFRKLHLPFVWFTAVFIFFLIASGKKGRYLLPLYPAASLLVAWFLDSIILNPEKYKSHRIICIPDYVLFGFIIVFSISIPFVVNTYFPVKNVNSVIISSLCIGVSVFSLVFLYRRKMAVFLMSKFLAVLIIFVLSVKIVIPEINRKKSAKPFCKKINTIMQPENKLAIFGFYKDAYLFYTGRKYIKVIQNTNDLKHFLNSEERRFLIIKPNELRDMQRYIKSPTYILLSDSIGHREIVFVSNKM